VDPAALRLEVALKLYLDGKLSQGAACELSSLSRREFLRVLGERGIPFTDITAEDLTEELARWKG